MAQGQEGTVLILAMGCCKSARVMLSDAKHLLFLVETKQKQILRADYTRVFK